MKKQILAASVIGLSVVLSACGGGISQTTGNQSPGGTIAATSVASGTIQKWTKGAGTVEYQDFRPSDSSTSSPMETVAAASLDAQGKFSLTLPNEATITPYLGAYANEFSKDEGCTGTQTGNVTATPTTFNYTSFGSLLVKQNDQIAANISTAQSSSNSDTSTGVYTVSSTANSWFYVDQPVTIKGSITCRETDVQSQLPVQITQNVSLTLVKGWNVLDFKFDLRVDNTGGTGTLTAKNGTPNVAYTWTTSGSFGTASVKGGLANTLKQNLAPSFLK